MANTIKKIILYLLGTVIVLSLIIVGLLYTGFASIYSEDKFHSSFIKFHALNEKDEYVIAEEIDSVNFNKSEFQYILEKFPVGESEAALSLTAHYKYYINLSELTHDLDERTLTIHIPALYLSTPVAVDTASIRMGGASRWFGRSTEELQQELLSDASLKLKEIGLGQINNVREKAAQALANNINRFFKNNNSDGYYDYIRVIFNDDNNNVLRLYEFNNSFCETGPCSFELDFGSGKTIVIE